MDLFFNELSIKEAPNKHTAIKWMDDLMVLYKKAAGKGFSELKTTETFINITIAPNYKLNEWMYDQAVPYETRLFFKTKVSKFPFIEKLLEQKEGEKQLLHEFKYKGLSAAGFGAAYLFDSLAVSFDNSSEWDTHLIVLDVTEYSEDDQVIHSIEEVKHSSKPVHLDCLSNWLKDKKKVSIPNGKLLWLKRNVHFPHLVFCQNVEDQVSYFSGSEPEFHMIVKQLSIMESYCSTWEGGIFTGDDFPSKVTSESESRRGRFKKELNIICPDGEVREFPWHLRYTPGAGRIHFAPDNSQRIFFIGYIGPKIK
jgi:hypothetical protein